MNPRYIEKNFTVLSEFVKTKIHGKIMQITGDLKTQKNTSFNIIHYIPNLII